MCIRDRFVSSHCGLCFICVSSLNSHTWIYNTCVALAYVFLVIGPVRRSPLSRCYCSVFPCRSLMSNICCHRSIVFFSGAYFVANVAHVLLSNGGRLAPTYITFDSRLSLLFLLRKKNFLTKIALQAGVCDLNYLTGNNKNLPTRYKASMNQTGIFF